MENLIDGFASLPGIGRKSAQRLAFHVLSLPQEEAERFANAVLEAKKSVHTCPVCQNLTDGELCPVCASDSRDKTTICVVSEPRDVLSIERSREYHGVYHVLHGALSPMNRIGPDDLRIRELLERVAQGGVEEVILATNPDTEGDATAMYLSRLLKPFGIRITRLGFGVPVGSNLEYADDATMLKALEGRREMYKSKVPLCKGSCQQSWLRGCSRWKMTISPARRYAPRHLPLHKGGSRGIFLSHHEHNPGKGAARPGYIQFQIIETGDFIILWHKN